LAIEAHQRLGAKGVTLNTILQSYIDQVEEHNRTLRVETAAIPDTVQGKLTAGQFCALKPHTDIENAITAAERAVAAARSQDVILKAATFQVFATLSFGIGELAELLGQGIHLSMRMRWPRHRCTLRPSAEVENAGSAAAWSVSTAQVVEPVHSALRV
jgi:hypothetical protein